MNLSGFGTCQLWASQAFVLQSIPPPVPCNAQALGDGSLAPSPKLSFWMLYAKSRHLIWQRSGGAYVDTKNGSAPIPDPRGESMLNSRNSAGNDHPLQLRCQGDSCGLGKAILL